MFRWYRDAAKCFVFLYDVSNSSSSSADWKSAWRNSRWFTRGWTLQELVAPANLEFFSAEGARIGIKDSMVQEIHEITGISTEALQGRPLSQFSINERLSWAARRETKREEDSAYSLLGIFDIHMPLIYGEGRTKAFNRLRREIQTSLTERWPALQPSSGEESKAHTETTFANTGAFGNESTFYRQHEAEEIFYQVITTFRDTLGRNEVEQFQEFNTSFEMLRDLQANCTVVPNHRKLSSLQRKIEQFTAAWEPFFEIVTIFEPTHPEWTALAWGAIRLVFLVSILASPR